MELSDETKSALRQMVDDTPVSFDRAKELYAENAAELRQSGAGDDDVAKFAMPMVQSELNQYSSVSPDATTLNALVIGHSGYQGWSDDDFDDSRIASQYGLDDVSKCPVLVAHAVLYPPHDDPALGGIIFRASDHDAMPDGETLESIRSKLTPLARVSGEFTYELSNNVHDYDFYEVNSTKSTDLQVETTDEDVDVRRQEVDTYVPRQVQIANIVSELSETDRYGFASVLGAEMVRVEGVIADYYLSDDGETALYTMQDNSMPDFRELDESVQDGGRTPGLTCWMQPEQMNYDTDSIVTLYGTLSKNSNSGRISLNTAGIAPQYAQEVNLSPSSQSASTDSRRSSSRSGQVQETTI